MFNKKLLTQAIIVASASSMSVAVQAQSALEEVVVTATKRAKSLQDVAIAVTAMGENELDEFNIANFDDYVRYLPGVNSAGRGPGQSSVFIRGMATDSSDQTSVEFGAPIPNVALYLDEQPASSTGRNLDVYAADLERVEVLPGPQGTLFGASSQAGTIRLITNKPNLQETQVSVDVSVSDTHKGESSHSEELVLNFPLIEGKLAVRGVFYNAVDGGYIDNVYGETSFGPGDVGFPTGATTTVANNADFVEDDFNDTQYTGYRFGAKYNINDDWSILGQFMHQELEADGVFDHAPSKIDDLQTPGEAPTGVGIGDLEVTRYFPDKLDDQFEQIGVTVEGRIGQLDVVYAGSYLDREVVNSFDYTGYTHVGTFSYYYLCQPSYTHCGSPIQGMPDSQVNNTRQTNELRISSDFDGGVNFIAGLYHDDAKTEVDSNFYVQAVYDSEAFHINRPLPGSTTVNPDYRPRGITYTNDITRREDQRAIFGEVNFDITEQVSATLGARYYEIDISMLGSTSFASAKQWNAVDEDDNGRNYDEIFADHLPYEQDDTIFKASLEYTPNDDQLYYVTYSEGFRPGGLNRPPESAFVSQTYDSDEVTNYEFGWKTTWLDGRVRFNGALYFIDWQGMQVGITDFENVGVVTFVSNVSDSEIYGLEGDITFAATDNLMLFASFSLLDTEMTKVSEGGSQIAKEGSEIALAPPVQLNLRARYEWTIADMESHAQLVYSYTDEQYSSVIEANRYLQDSYQTVDASFGMAIDEHWGAELFVENLTDERAELFINSLDTSLRITTNRPRTVGLRVSYDY
ncbi:TonB-dependent receptor [Dasania sp. GY-MA-18]|uniref:TonB-dependent receptor n=1 Tax=Dasania phycosphaerae TaxID=2950436 RepID=A0A9J6RNT8_9GAMM|nr:MULTISPECIES: TonB-dependent receptor [Dasania]MCR8923415.1 TonB-dependent receptor [Dasania sp. GY-MA-18]MCZ0865848.1 TonB-dependent receptor [Dasania phycosphaerae]MCZ0869572.1 TonB-dependent receptor [Dasania phycosphaerae]